MSSSSSSIESVLTETRSFPPPAEFAAQARVKSLAEYEALYTRAEQDPEGFWGEVAGELGIPLETGSESVWDDDEILVGVCLL